MDRPGHVRADSRDLGLPPRHSPAHVVRSPEEVATSGWWTGGYGPGSYGEAFANGAFAGALGATAQRGLLVAVVVLLVAVPAAYALTPEQLPRRARRIVAAAAVTFAVLPPQVLAVPLGKVMGLSLGGTVILSFVHAALVLPLGVLLLRNAFMSVPRPWCCVRSPKGVRRCSR